MEANKNIFDKNDYMNNHSFCSQNASISQQPLENNTPLFDIDQSATPLNNMDDDRHSFFFEVPKVKRDQEYNSIQMNGFTNYTPQTSYGELNHIKGAEQRQRLFTQLRNQEIPEQSKTVDEQHDIHSPSLTSNSIIFKMNDDSETSKFDKKFNNKGTSQKSLNRLKSCTITQKQQQEERCSSSTKLESFSQIDSKQFNLNKQKVINGNILVEQMRMSEKRNTWNEINDSAKNTQQYIGGSTSAQNINQDKATQSAVNTISDVSVNLMSNKLVKMYTDDRDNVKSSSNFLHDSQKKLQIGQENQNISNIFMKGDKMNNNNIDQIYANKRQSSTSNANAIPFMDLKRIVDSQYHPNVRQISNLLDIPSPSNFAGGQNMTSYGRKNSEKTQISQKTLATSKKRNFLKIFFLTYKFLSKLRFIKQYKNIYMLEKRHFKLIKDNAFGDLYERQGHKNPFYRMLRNLYYFLFDIKSPFHAFQPNSLPLLIFDLSMLAILIFLVFYIPIKVCFSHAQGYSEHHSITSLIDIIPYILMLEIFINLNTAYFSQGTTVNDRKLIIKRYVSFKFWVDLITIICLNQSNIVPLVFILRAYQIFKILYNLDETFQIQFKFPTTFELTKLVIIILFVAHICACGFHLILDYQSSNLESWIAKSNLYNKPWIEIYVASLYFSFTTMITVGFGDIVPNTLLERVYVIIIQLISCGVFAYAINTVGSKQYYSIKNKFQYFQIFQQIGIFQEIARKSAEYRQ